MGNFDKAFDISDKWIEKFSKRINKIIIGHLLSSFVFEGNKLLPNSENLTTVLSLEGLIDEDKINKQFTNHLWKQLGGIVNETFDQYKEHGGINDNKGDVNKGFKTRFKEQRLNDPANDYYRKLREQLVVKVTQGSTIAELNSFMADKSPVGSMKRAANYYYTTYQRTLANDLRQKAGLKFASYEGGLINTSREWCKLHDNNIYSEDQIAAWAFEEWEGKNDNYNPFTDCGGYECRHRWQWLSESAAKFLRDG